MSTPYESIYGSFLSKIKSYEIPLMDETEVKEYLHDYLVSASSKFYACRQDLTDRDDEFECFNCDLSDVEIEIISNYMTIDYIDSNYVRDPKLLEVMLSSKDFNAFSNANLLDKITATQERYLSENETLLTRYAWMGMKDSTLLNDATVDYLNR